MGSIPTLTPLKRPPPLHARLSRRAALRRASQRLPSPSPKPPNLEQSLLGGLEARLLGDGALVRAVALLVVRAAVELLDVILAAVDGEDVAGADHGVAVGRPDVAAAATVDAEHDDA